MMVKTHDSSLDLLDKTESKMIEGKEITTSDVDRQVLESKTSNVNSLAIEDINTADKSKEQPKETLKLEDDKDLK